MFTYERLCNRASLRVTLACVHRSNCGLTLQLRDAHQIFSGRCWCSLHPRDTIFQSTSAVSGGPFEAACYPSLLVHITHLCFFFSPLSIEVTAPVSMKEVGGYIEKQVAYLSGEALLNYFSINHTFATCL